MRGPRLPMVIYLLASHMRLLRLPTKAMRPGRNAASKTPQGRTDRDKPIICEDRSPDRSGRSLSWVNLFLEDYRTGLETGPSSAIDTPISAARKLDNGLCCVDFQQMLALYLLILTVAGSKAL
jgi:hypothetical protein